MSRILKKITFSALLISAFSKAQHFETIKDSSGTYPIKKKREIKNLSFKECANLIRLNGVGLENLKVDDGHLTYNISFFIGKPPVKRIGNGFGNAYNCTTRFVVSLFEIKDKIYNTLEYKDITCAADDFFQIATESISFSFTRQAKNYKFNMQMIELAEQGYKDIEKKLNYFLQLNNDH